MDGWEQQVGKNEKAAYNDSGYTIQLPNANDKTSRLLNVDIQDVSVNLTYSPTLLTPYTGNGSFLGAYCRYRDDDNFYAAGRFVTSDNGTHLIGIVKKEKGRFTFLARQEFKKYDRTKDSGRTLSGIGYPELITVNGQEQELSAYEMRCIGQRLSLYINHELVTSIIDNTFSSGDAGLGYWTGRILENKPHGLDLRKFTVKDYSGIASQDLEGKLARGEEVVIYKTGFDDPPTSPFCTDAKKIPEDYNSHVDSCKNGILYISNHKPVIREDNIVTVEGILMDPLVSNLVLDVDAKLLTGTLNWVPLAINGYFSDGTYATYYLVLSDDGFDIKKCTQDLVCKSITGVNGQNYTPDPAINLLKLGNHLTIKLIDGSVYFYINHKLSAKLDEDIVYGILGLAYPFDDTVIAYDDLTLKIPSQNEIDQEKQLFSKKLSLERPDPYIKEAQDIFGTMVFGKDGLEFKILHQSVTYRHNVGPVLENTSIQADFKPDVPLTYGLYCRRSDYARYEAVYSIPDGVYTIYNYVNDTVFTKLASGKADIKINKDSDKVVYNTMRLDCIGNQISFYLDNQLLAKVRNGEYRRGSLGLTAGNDSDEAPVTGAFKNLVIEEKASPDQ